jgi:outer membrane receptor protein involved in Fe transport
MKHFVKFFIILLPIYSNAQYFVGQLKDKDNFVPISDASIICNKNLSISDRNGFFRIQAKFGDTLRIHSIGYITKLFLINREGQFEYIYLSPSNSTLKEVEVNSKLGTKLLSNIHRLDLLLRPLNNSQEVLRMVPGLFIGQHQGGGKAEQLFLRGFDVDHGTDVNISADGLPVNMVSHAHGQGYADLHFVIPETIKEIDFGKGTYYADKGDFTTAGYVALQTFDKLPNNLIKMEGGMFNTIRTVGLFNLLPQKQTESAYMGIEAFHTDGPFDSPQKFKRYNFISKYQVQKGKTLFTTQFSTFWSKWNASGQIPERSVNDGSIGWFGAIDHNEGGQTSKTNFSVKALSVLANDARLENQIYFTTYNFELYSNFTFFKIDPINGDQIRQKELRNIFGYNGTYTNDHYFNNGSTLQTKVGANIRLDEINHLELSRTLDRAIITAPLSNGTGSELNLASYVSETFKANRWTLNGAFRLEHFVFGYTDILNNKPNRTIDKAIVSPKFNLQYQLNNTTALYLKIGKGFHSNDIRVVIPQSGREVLPVAWGADLGVITKPIDKMVLNVALWALKLDQEFVYVGDEAVVEPGGRTFRRGLELSMRYEIAKNLFTDVDANYTIGRAIDNPIGSQYLSLAPVFSSTGGLSYNGYKFKIGLRYRCLGDRPANEDNSIKAYGYNIFDANVSYKLTPKTSIGLSAENIFNVKWKETQFLTESKLQNELMPVNEINFTPGTPLFLKARWVHEF